MPRKSRSRSRGHTRKAIMGVHKSQQIRRQTIQFAFIYSNRSRDLMKKIVNTASDSNTFRFLVRQDCLRVWLVNWTKIKRYLFAL